VGLGITLPYLEALVAIALVRSFAVGLVGAGSAPGHGLAAAAPTSDDARYAAFAKDCSSKFFPPPYA
jgi:hypothetical protein